MAIRQPCASGAGLVDISLEGWTSNGRQYQSVESAVYIRRQNPSGSYSHDIDDCRYHSSPYGLFVLVVGALFPDDVCDKMILFGGVCRNNTTVLIAIALMALAFHLTIIFNALRLRNGDAHR